MNLFTFELPLVPSALAMFAVGGMVCFFGFKLFKVVLGLVGFLAGAVAAAGFITFFAPGEQLVMAVAAVVAGICGALLLIFAFKVGVFFIGAVSGLLVGSFVGTWLSPTLEVVVVIVLALVGGVLALKLQRIMIGISTALLGAAAMVYAGLTVLIGVEATETLIKRVPDGAEPGHEGWIAALCWMVLAGVGIGIQLSSEHKKK